jgi:two-component sensor histidine kinase
MKSIPLRYRWWFESKPSRFILITFQHLRTKPWIGYLSTAVILFLISMTAYFRTEALLIYYPLVVLATFMGGFGSGMMAAIVTAVFGFFNFAYPYATFAFLFDTTIVVILISTMNGMMDTLSEQLETQEHLTKETNHRIQNMLAVIQSVIMLSFNGRKLNSLRDNIISRLVLLGNTNRYLTDANAQLHLGDLIQQELNCWIKQVSISGPEVSLTGKLAQNFALIIHELTTNAIKYGALSHESGSITIEWATTDNFYFRWREHKCKRCSFPTWRTESA